MTYGMICIFIAMFMYPYFYVFPSVYSVSLCRSVYCLCVNVYCTAATGCQCVLYCCHRVSMCTVLLPPGVNVIAVNKYIYHIISYIIYKNILYYYIF
jgi:hypothetical protein